MSAESLAELRTWYQAHKSTEECALALKHRHGMHVDVAAELKRRYPDVTAIDEERELALLFSLYQIASQLDSVELLMRNMRAIDLRKVADEQEAAAQNAAWDAAHAQAAALVPVAHVDVTPLVLESHPEIADEAEHADEAPEVSDDEVTAPGADGDEAILGA